MSVKGLFVGRSTLDIVYACDAFPGPDDKIDARAGYVRAGGPAMNAAIAFADLGGRALLLTEVGEGPLADGARTDAERHGVEILDAAAGRPDALPVSSIVRTGASRAVLSQTLPDGAEPDRVALARALAAHADVVMSDGHLPALALPVLRQARTAGVVTVLDGGSWKAWTAELLPWIDIAIASSRFRPPGEADPLALLRRSARAAAITNGPDPIRWSAGAGSGEVRPPSVKAVDTLGAGDVFHGAFCHAYAVSRDFEASLTSAAKVASRACGQYGARIS